jgi:hypothetical protein
MLAMKSVESQRHDDVPFHLPQRARGDVTRWEQAAFGCKKWCGDGALSRPPGGRERAWRPRVIPRDHTYHAFGELHSMDIIIVFG